MKVLVLFALAALVAAEAEPEADPQVLLHSGNPIVHPLTHPINHPIAPIMTVKTEDQKPITYTIPAAGMPFTGLPYTGMPFTGLRYTGMPLTMSGMPLTTSGMPLTTSGMPLAGNPFMYNTWPYTFNPMTTVVKTEEATPVAVEETTRTKREADPQVLINPGSSMITLTNAEAQPFVFGNTPLGTLPVVNVKGEEKTTLPLTYTIPSGIPATHFPMMNHMMNPFINPITYSGLMRPTTLPYPVAYTLAKTE